jgi:hypothetical protein
MKMCVTIFIFFTIATGFCQPVLQLNLYGYTLVTIYALVKSFPTCQHCGLIKKDYFLVISYFISQIKSTSKWVLDVIKIIIQNSEKWYWGQPEFVYYLNFNKWVMVKLIQHLSNAGVYLVINASIKNKKITSLNHLNSPSSLIKLMPISYPNNQNKLFTKIVAKYLQTNARLAFAFHWAQNINKIDSVWGLFNSINVLERSANYQFQLANNKMIYYDK